MKASSKFRTGTFRTVSLLLVVLVAVSVFLTIRSASERNHAVFARAFKAASSRVQSANYSDALSDISAAVRSASTRTEWFGVLALVRTVSDRTNDPDLFASAALKAAADLPGSEDLWALAVHGLQRSGKPVDAWKTAEKRLRSERYFGLRAEAALRAGRKTAADVSLLPENLKAVLAVADPDIVDPERFIEAGRASGERAFMRNASLLYAREGKLREAVTIFTSRFPPDADLSLETRKLGSLLAWDAGERGTALAYLGYGHPDMPLEEHFLLLSSDILLDSSEPLSALALYRKTILRYPESTWLPYLNAAWIERSEGNPSTALDILEKGLRSFPDDSRLAAAYGRLLYTTGQTERADEFLDSYSTRFPKNENIRLLSIKLSRKPIQPERFEAELWALYNDHHESGEVLGFLCWYLLGKGDRAGLGSVIDTIPERYASIPAAVLYRAVHRSLSGDEAAGLEEFSALAKKAPSWIVYFNMGMLQERRGDIREAERAYRESLRLHTLDAWKRSGNPAGFDGDRARILCALGGVYAAEGKREEMEQAAKTALMLDPGNLRAYTLLRTPRVSAADQIQ